MAQFDALLTILEPHIKKKTTNFCELSVQGSIYSALCCETKWMNLIILDFGVRFYGGSELSKHLSKCLPRMRKNAKKSNPIQFFLWQTKISEAVCKRDWHNVRYLFFNVRKFRTKNSDSVCNGLNSTHRHGSYIYRKCLLLNEVSIIENKHSVMK